MRFDRLLINTGDCDDHSYGPSDPNPVKFYEPTVAKKNYDSVTGNINACGRVGRREAYKQSWFFCSFKKGIKRKRVPWLHFILKLLAPFMFCKYKQNFYVKFLRISISHDKIFEILKWY